MRIAYLLEWNDAFESGVLRKVVTQTNFWARAGCRVEVFLTCKKGTAAAAIDRPDWHIHPHAGPVGRLRAHTAVLRQVARSRPDIIYRRFSPFLPHVLALRRLAPIVTEINTDDPPEFELGPRLRWAYHALTRPIEMRASSAFVSVSRELLDRPYNKVMAGKTLVLGNSIDLSGYGPPSPIAQGVPTRVAFIGSTGQPWQGFEEVIALARMRPEWRFDIIGARKDELGENLPRNVIPYGPLPRSEYEPILRQATIGLGTLALWRKRMNETSPLKTREYLALGLPCVIGYRDTDFYGVDEEFLLQVPNRQGALVDSVEAVDRFVQAWRGRRVPREKIRHLDVRDKERLRLEFLERIAG